MTIYLLCDCGKKLKARSEYAGRRVMCSRCRQVWRLPGQGIPTAFAEEPVLLSEEGASEEPSILEHTQRTPVAVWVCGAVLLAVFLFVTFYLAHWYNSLGSTSLPPPAAVGGARSAPEPSVGREAPVEVQKPEAPRREADAQEVPRPPPPPEDKPREAVNPPPEEKPAEDPPTAAVIERVEPSEPVAGSSVVIMLRDKGPGGDAIQYEYRVSPKEPWQPVLGQRIKIADLKPGKLDLEVRVVDPRGRPAPIVQRPIVVQPAPGLLSRLKVGDVLYQELVISRVSTYRLLGADVSQNTQYGFLSSLTVDQRFADGSLLVIQKVEVARMEKADPVLQSLLGNSLDKTKGMTFRITLSPKHEILKFESPAQPPQVFGGNAIFGQAFLVWSFVDQDAWKEIAQICFFLPEKPLQKDEKWSKKLNHSWGALGMWSGDMAFHHVGLQNKQNRIDYTLKLFYQPPAAGGSGLPFKVSKTQFTPQAAGGAILFDPVKARVTEAEERFHVRGQLDVNLLGTATPVEMDELQIFRVRMHDKRPVIK
jgi:hypothetical protein